MTYSEGNGRSSKQQSWRKERRKQKRRKRRRQSKQQQPNSPFGTRNPKHPTAVKTTGTPVTSNNRNKTGQPTTRESKLRTSRVCSPTRTRSQTTSRTRRAAVAAEVDAGDDYQHREPPRQVGGRLSSFSHRWKPVTSNPWVLQTVASGYRLEFTSSFPHQCRSWTSTLPKDTENNRNKTGNLKTGNRKLNVIRSLNVADQSKLMSSPMTHDSS